MIIRDPPPASTTKLTISNLLHLWNIKSKTISKLALHKESFCVRVWEDMIRDHADSLEPYTEYLTVGLINIQWSCHGWMDRNYLQSTDWCFLRRWPHWKLIYFCTDHICFLLFFFVVFTAFLSLGVHSLAVVWESVWSWVVLLSSSFYRYSD